MAAFKFYCSKCDQELETDDCYAGMEFDCPSCGTKVIAEKPKTGIRILRRTPAPAAPQTAEPLAKSAQPSKKPSLQIKNDIKEEENEERERNRLLEIAAAKQAVRRKWFKVAGYAFFFFLLSLLFFVLTSQTFQRRLLDMLAASDHPLLLEWASDYDSFSAYRKLFEIYKKENKKGELEELSLKLSGFGFLDAVERLRKTSDGRELIFSEFSIRNSDSVNPDALFILGVMHYIGFGTEISKTNFVHYMEKSAENGSPAAALALSHWFSIASGNPRFKSLSEEWKTKADALRSPESPKTLLERDLSETSALFQKFFLYAFTFEKSKKEYPPFSSDVLEKKFKKMAKKKFRCVKEGETVEFRDMLNQKISGVYEGEYKNGAYKIGKARVPVMDIPQNKRYLFDEDLCRQQRKAFVQESIRKEYDLYRKKREMAIQDMMTKKFGTIEEYVAGKSFRTDAL